MNVFMIGGTGLLGCEAAKVLIEKGHKVTSVALPPLPAGAPIPKEMDIILYGSDEEIRYTVTSTGGTTYNKFGYIEGRRVHFCRRC